MWQSYSSSQWSRLNTDSFCSQVMCLYAWYQLSGRQANQTMTEPLNLHENTKSLLSLDATDNTRSQTTHKLSVTCFELCLWGTMLSQMSQVSQCVSDSMNVYGMCACLGKTRWMLIKMKVKAVFERLASNKCVFITLIGKDTAFTE